jgi:hypothetical protein
MKSLDSIPTGTLGSSSNGSMLCEDLSCSMVVSKEKKETRLKIDKASIETIYFSVIRFIFRIQNFIPIYHHP